MNGLMYITSISGNILIFWNRSFMVSTRDTKSMLIGNSQLSKTGYEFCLLYLYLYTLATTLLTYTLLILIILTTYIATSIEQMVFTFKHGLNIGQSIYQYRLLLGLLIIRLQAQ